MDLFWKATASILLTVILSLAMGKEEKCIALILSITVCCMTGVIAVSFLKPIIDFFDQLQSYANLEKNILHILMKVLGISIITELICMVCTDSGRASLGKVLAFLASCVVMWLSLPIINQLLELLKHILGAV